MRTSTIATMMAAIVIGAAIAPVVPAAAQTAMSAAPDRAGATIARASHQQILLRRNGDRAVPFDPVVGASETPALRRDGSRAVPFAAEVGPQAGPADSGFDWNDAMIGAATACGLMLLAVGALMLARGIQPRTPACRHTDSGRGPMTRPCGPLELGAIRHSHTRVVLIRGREMLVSR